MHMPMSHVSCLMHTTHITRKCQCQTNGYWHVLDPFRKCMARVLHQGETAFEIIMQFIAYNTELRTHLFNLTAAASLQLRSCQKLSKRKDENKTDNRTHFIKMILIAFTERLKELCFSKKNITN